MSKYFRYGLIIVAGLALAPAQDKQAPLSITISADNIVLKAGSEVKIRVVLKNISDHEILYTRTPGAGVERHGEFFTDVEVRDSKGELLPETRYHRALRGKNDMSAEPPRPEKVGSPLANSGFPEPLPKFVGSFTRHVLKPGEFREEDIVISRLYELSQPGQYTISASRHVSDLTTDPKSKPVAKSNTLLITVTR